MSRRERRAVEGALELDPLEREVAVPLLGVLGLGTVVVVEVVDLEASLADLEGDHELERLGSVLRRARGLDPVAPTVDAEADADRVGARLVAIDPDPDPIAAAVRDRDRTGEGARGHELAIALADVVDPPGGL